MIGFGESVEINLDVKRFINDDETRAVAVVVAKHAENRRTAYRLTEKPGGRGMVRGKFYWSQTVPWYEWMSEHQILQPCAEECGLKIWQLADVIAYQIRPSNWQVFAWMSVALQSKNYEAVISDALFQKIKKMRDQSQSDARTALAKQGAAGRHTKDPKQADKALVHECWIDWQKQPDRYKGKAAFARDMRDKFPNLESQPVIEGWCRAWERET